jgi:hypothetical protein
MARRTRQARRPREPTYYLENTRSR